MNLQKICQKDNRIPITYRKDKQKAISLLKEIKEKNVKINNPDIYSLASWVGFSIEKYNSSDIFSEVEEIKYEGKNNTYDLHIKEGNSYVANGIICHNTINLPEDVSVEEVAKIYETAWKSGCKGITVYRKNSRSGVLIDTKDNKPHILYTTSPKRPKSLPCDIYHVSVKGEEYFVIIGFLNGNEPYEVFAGKNSNISKNLKKAQIRKAKRGQYELCDIIDEKIILHDNISQYIDEEQEAITRLLSAGLRHGCSIDFIVHSLEKTRGDLMGFAKAICRILKKYVKDGATVKGEECPECGSKLFRIEGCISCQSCGWTKC